MGSRAPRGGGGRAVIGGEFRPCLRPLACPYAAPAGRLAGDPRTWTDALLDLLPGDPELALDLVAVLVESRIGGQPES